MADLSKLAADYAAKTQAYQTALDAMEGAENAYKDHAAAANKAHDAMTAAESTLLQAAREALYGKGITGAADEAKSKEEPEA